MALVPLATKGNYFHVYDFRVKTGRGDEFVDLFNKFDYGDNNPFVAALAFPARGRTPTGVGLRRAVAGIAGHGGGCRICQVAVIRLNWDTVRKISASAVLA